MQKGMTIATPSTETPSLEKTVCHEADDCPHPCISPVSNHHRGTNVWKCHAPASSAGLCPHIIWKTAFNLGPYNINGPKQKAQAAACSENRGVGCMELKRFAHHHMWALRQRQNLQPGCCEPHVFSLAHSLPGPRSALQTYTGHSPTQSHHICRLWQDTLGRQCVKPLLLFHTSFLHLPIGGPTFAHFSKGLGCAI